MVVLSSTFLRHQHAINTIARDLDVAGVWQEEKSFVPERYATTASDHEVIARHFAARDAAEHRFFVGDTRLDLDPAAVVRRGAPGLVNDRAEIETMAALDPDVVLVFGTGLLRGDIISRFSGRIINLHLGLSPYYRGAGTNFWPLVNREPELVGATVHYLDAGIDTGPILEHARPEISAADGPHDLGNKAIVAGVRALIDCARLHAENRARAVPQAGGGRLYQRQDFSADAVRRMYRQFDTGMVDEYLSDRARRDAAVPLLTQQRP
ncbi:MAG: formyl transferase [Acidobacteriota bacterium]